VAEQQIEAPSDADVDAIARAWLHANAVCRDVLGVALDGSIADLSRLQMLLDSGVIDREATYTLQALGIAFGKVFVNDNPGYDWWMVEDEYGRDPAIRYERSSLLAYPRTMLSKRIEDGEKVDVLDLYDGLRTRLAQLIEDGYSAT
jgi:hypothetical protein